MPRRNCNVCLIAFSGDFCVQRMILACSRNTLPVLRSSQRHVEEMVLCNGAYIFAIHVS